MKITQMMIARGFGGAERYFVDLSLALADMGHDLQVICHEQFTGMPLLGNRPGMHIRPFRIRGWWDVLARRNIHKAIVSFAPDVIHAHLARGAYLGGKISACTGIPLVVKTHNYVNLKYYRDVDMFLPTTTDQKQYLEDNGIKPEKIRVIPNFSAITPVAEPGAVSSSGTTRISAMGRMVKKKGFDVLIRALEKMNAQGHDIVLHLGGDGPEKKNLQQLASELGISNRVVFTGWVSDVSGFLRGTSLFVLPSYDEPFGIVVLEAMSQGVAIVSTPTQGPIEILDDRIAWFAEAGDVNLLADTIMNAIGDVHMRAEKASRALEKFKTTYTRECVVPELVSVYQSLAGRDS